MFVLALALPLPEPEKNHLQSCYSADLKLEIQIG